MRRSAMKHTVAVLRNVIGLSQPDFADLIAKSPSTIAQIETNKLPLSEEIARWVEHETGVSAEWLLMNNPSAPIRDSKGRDYTEETFKRTQIENAQRTAWTHDGACRYAGLITSDLLSQILQAAKMKRLDLFFFKWRAISRALEKDFAGRQALMDTHLDRAFAEFQQRLATIIPPSPAASPSPAKQPSRPRAVRSKTSSSRPAR